ncbi:glycosyltransferase [Streptomyces sp. JJ66]|uniref:glycosyltransferase n=1 Tax=Streptomyces sp. JJ66 TaxID=2803843 RepID=UPI001C5906ED|nr:glycosyltransferase [Streptomyces sp. JJ66]MBW1602646.1 glycosyltransferase [Streptomyces sp. JJ66]
MVRRIALGCAALLAVAAVAQQVMIAVGRGGWLPGWQPWPYLLAAVPLWLLAGRPLPARTWAPPRWLLRVPPWVLLCGVLALTAVVWAALQDYEPYLGHEEAVYANKARFWLDGTPDAGWGIYRPPGLPALGWIALHVHPSAGMLRLVALLLTLLTLTVTYLVAARWTTPRQAVVVMLLLLSGLGFLRRMPEFLNDIAATGLLLIVVFLLTRVQERDGDDRAARIALLTLPGVILAAFYLRYGVTGNLLAIVLAALLVYGPRVWLAHARTLAVALSLLLAGLLPHFVYAVQLTGRPLGLILSATEQANRIFVGDGLLYYLLIFPYRLAGDLGAVVMTAGLAGAVAAARAVRRRGGTARDRRPAFLAATALLTFVVLGLATDGEPRFVYLPVILLTVLGVRTLAERAGRHRPALLGALAGLALVTVPATAQAVAHGAMPGPTRQAASTVPVARALAADGRPCLLVTGYEPEMGWYSGCDAVTYRQYRAMNPPPPATTVHLVTFARGRLQPDAAGLTALTRGHRTDVRSFPATGPLGTATVTTLLPGPRPPSPGEPAP